MQMKSFRKEFLKENESKKIIGGVKAWKILVLLFNQSF